MLVLDLILRYATCTLLLLVVLLVVRDARHRPPARYAALVCMAVAALLLGTQPPAFEFSPGLHTLVRFLDVPSIGFIWWFGRSLFEDDFKLGFAEWLGMALVVFPTLLFRLNELSLINMDLSVWLYASAVFSTGLMVHLVYVTLAGRHDDMIEERRRTRVYFVLGLVIATILIVISERIFSPTYEAELSFFRVIITLPMALWGLLWLVRLHPEKLEFKAVSPALPSPPTIDPRDKSLYEALMKEMTERQAYRQPGLTIGVLSEHLGAPEHRLRALINKGLGYRNFSRFLNEYRVAAVQATMQQPENARLPILSIALDVGFNSLAPFNRAFRIIVGETPTKYREKLLNSGD